MQLTTIMAFITALGGLEAIKWLVRFVTFRKMDVRKEEASINSMEAENRRKTVDWFEERLEQRVNPEKPDVPLNKNDAFQKVQKRRVQEKR